ncbi:hypothetical protein [Tateyamaria sp. SN6-1]|uniref:hypothetical protein n=1 Tax=Tateyamaria sp. SN6-1 TaxID=3092148 RepID=UPI0039F4C139
MNAIVEATWHDNAVSDADQAAQDPTQQVDYDQLENVSVSDAVTWAHQMAGDVTLYLYDEGRGTSVRAYEGRVEG